MESITKVIFRTWKDTGEIIALFPEIPSSTVSHDLCESYMHGQHGCVNPYLMLDRKNTIPVTDEAKKNELREELEKIGYRLQEMQHISHVMHRKRREAWEEMEQKAK